MVKNVVSGKYRSKVFLKCFLRHSSEDIALNNIFEIHKQKHVEAVSEMIFDDNLEMSSPVNTARQLCCDIWLKSSPAKTWHLMINLKNGSEFSLWQLQVQGVSEILLMTLWKCLHKWRHCDNFDVTLEWRRHGSKWCIWNRMNNVLTSKKRSWLFLEYFLMTFWKYLHQWRQCDNFDVTLKLPLRIALNYIFEIHKQKHV